MDEINVQAIINKLNVFNEYDLLYKAAFNAITNSKTLKALERWSLNDLISYRCIKCNEAVSIDSLARLADRKTINCGKYECICFVRGNAFRGKTRPEHSAKMKLKTRELIDAGILWNAEHRKNSRLARNSDKSRKNTLVNKGLINPDINDPEIIRAEFAKFASNRSKSLNHFRNCALRVYAREADSIYALLNIDIQPILNDISSRQEFTIEDRIRYNSIKSHLAYARHPDTMGIRSVNQFKRRQFVSSQLKSYTGIKSEFTTRSSSETNYIYMIDDIHKWQYEEILINTKRGGYHYPDFIVDGDIVEVKGKFIIFDDDSVDIILDKLISTRDYCQLSSIRYYIIFSKNLNIRIDITEYSDDDMYNLILRNKYDQNQKVNQ